MNANNVRNRCIIHNVNARSLILWKVSILVNDGFKENVRRVELRDEDALLSVVKLLKVFLGQPEDGISILSYIHCLLVSSSHSSLTFTYRLPCQWHHILDHTLLRHLNPSRMTCSKLNRNVTEGLPTSLLSLPGFLRNLRSCRLGPLAQSFPSIVLQVPLQWYP